MNVMGMYNNSLTDEWTKKIPDRLQPAGLPFRYTSI